MVTTKPGRRQRAKAVLRARIVSAAIGLFGKKGIEAVTVDEIAAAADVGKGTTYNYFRTKEEIIVAFMADFERKVQAKVAKLDPSLPLEDALTECIRLQFRMKASHHAFVRVFFGQMFLRTAAFVPYMLEIHSLSLPPLQALFRGFQDRGALRRDVSIDDLTSTFVNLHLGLTALWAVEGPPFRMTEEALVRQVRFFCEGVEAKK
jgi:AcrR family transcriptional regulator